MQTRPAAWLWRGGGLAGIAGALALGDSPTLLIAGAHVLACPLAMVLGMRTMCGRQETRPDDGHQATVPEPRHTLQAAHATC